MAESINEPVNYLTSDNPKELLINGSCLPDENENIQLKDNVEIDQTSDEAKLTLIKKRNLFKNINFNTNKSECCLITHSDTTSNIDTTVNDNAAQDKDVLQITEQVIASEKQEKSELNYEINVNFESQKERNNKSVSKENINLVKNQEHFKDVNSDIFNNGNKQSKLNITKSIPFGEDSGENTSSSLNHELASIENKIPGDNLHMPSVELKSSDISANCETIINADLQNGDECTSKLKSCDAEKSSNNFATEKPNLEDEEKKLEEKHLLLSKLNIMPKSELKKNNDIKEKSDVTNRSKLDCLEQNKVDLTLQLNNKLFNCISELKGDKSTKRDAVMKTLSSGPVKKRRKLTSSISPRCNDPFKKGWKRELVFRSTCDESKNRAADVYYYSPANEKLRSYREIEDFLKRTKEKDLSIDCFTFMKISIHEAPQEIVRYARPRHELFSRKKSVNKSFPNKSMKTFKNIELKKDIKLSENNLPGEMPVQAILQQPKKQNVNIVKTFTSKRRGKILFGRTKKTHIKPKINVEEKPCSLSCPGYIGVLPSLHCKVCLCLFHPSCVGFVDDSKPFICSKCLTDRKRINHTNLENGRKRQRDVLNLSSSPVSIEVNPELIVEDDYVPSSPLKAILPSLLSSPPKPFRNTPLEKPRPPPPLKKAPTTSSSTVPIKTTATWTPPSGLSSRQPPPLQLATPLQNIRPAVTNGQLCPRLPPPLTASPFVSPRTEMSHPVVGHLNPVYSQNKRFVTPSISVSKTAPQSLQTNHNGQVPSLSSSVKPSIYIVDSTKNSALINNLRAFINVQNPLTGNLKTYSRTLQVPSVNVNRSEIRPTNLKPEQMAQHSSSSVVNSSQGTTKFVLKTNSGTTTEVLVPQIKQTPGSGTPQPKYIIVNKQGQPTGLVVGVGKEVLQLPILNQTSSSNSEKLLKDAVASSNSKNIHETIVLDDDGTKSETTKPTESESQDYKTSNVLTKKPPTAGSVFMNDSATAGDNCKNSAKITKRHQARTNPARCNIQWLHGGINSLMKIFEYLHQDDLSRVSSVCRTWHWLASQPNLWKTVKLNGILVYDWENLVAIMKKYGSVRLDMRKMLTFEDRNRTWHGFAAILQDLKMLKFIHFGCIPVSILHTVINTLSQLEELTADFVTDICRESEIPISNCRMDLRKLGQLSCLQKLRLHGMHGIQLQGSSMSYSLSNLEILKNLTYLSLTTLKDIPIMEFQFLKSLTSLETLELGECTEWTNETFENLNSLKNLKRLRLEYGGTDTNHGLVLALSRFQNLVHFELFRFKLNEYLMNHVEQMQNLQALSLWPQEVQGEVINTLILKTVRRLLNLRVFVWGVITDTSYRSAPHSQHSLSSDVDVIDIASDDEDENKNNTDATECIPFSLIELTAEDGVENPKEYLSLIQLHSRLSKILIKTTRIIHPISSENPCELSRIAL